MGLRAFSAGLGGDDQQLGPGQFERHLQAGTTGERQLIRGALGDLMRHAVTHRKTLREAAS